MDFTSLTPAQILDLGKPCKEFEELLRTRKSPKFDWSDPAKVLAFLRCTVSAAVEADQKDPEVDQETLYAPARDGFMLQLEVFRAAAPSSEMGYYSTAPLIVLYHPGGFMLGHPKTLSMLARRLVKRFNAVVVAPTYRLAPEHPFPTGVNDGWDALSWIAENASSTLRANPERGFVVGGISAGGNITNVVTHLARDNAMRPPLTGVWLSCAGARLAPKDMDKLPDKYRERYLSRTQEECINSLVSPPEMQKLSKDCLKPDYDSELFSPLIWPTEAGHKGFPRTYSQVCGMDAPRDESLILDDMLKSEGIPTRLDLYPGLPHFFFQAFRSLPQSKQWMADTMDGFAWLLASPRDGLASEDGHGHGYGINGSGEDGGRETLSDERGEVPD